MSAIWKCLTTVGLVIWAGSAGAATLKYWNLFNLEGESNLSAVFVTYATLDDMLNDENRTGSFTADGNAPFGANIVGTGSDGTTWWNLFNLEGEDNLSAVFVTYASFDDMLNDENRTGSFTADGNAPFGANIVGTGSDGTTWWNLFNLEGEDDLSAIFVTYDSLFDMLNDENRTGSFTADGNAPFGANIVGTGSDGTTWWNLFNLEGEDNLSAVFVTYASLFDMLNDENRTGSFTADGNAPFGANIVGTGAFYIPDAPPPIPLPAAGWILLTGIGALRIARHGIHRRRCLGGVAPV
jgi:hypothetical protein